jgi:5-methylcytosine-specific restriction endonuclease McrA
MTKKNKRTNFQKKYHKYLLSSGWKIKRDKIISEKGCCSRCGKMKSLHVHHLTYKNIFNENSEDLIVLCKSCRREEHKSEKQLLPRSERKRLAIAREFKRLEQAALRQGKVTNWSP